MTIVAVIIFVSALAWQSPHESKIVSQKTFVHDDSPGIMEGSAPGGLLSIVKITHPPEIPTRLKVANHQRTLRAFVGAWENNLTGLFIESVRPHNFYYVEGGFFVSETKGALHWTDNQTVGVRVVLPNGKRGSMSINIKTFASAFQEEAVSTRGLDETLEMSNDGIL